MSRTRNRCFLVTAVILALCSVLRSVVLLMKCLFLSLDADFRTPLMPIPANSNKNANQRHHQSQQQLPSSQPASQRSHHHHNHHHHSHHQAAQENSQPLEPATIALTASPHEDALQALSARLESELRTAKRRHLACTEVLLPADLLPRIASQMFELSEKEPCGIRGCTVYIEFEDEPDNSR